MTTELTWRIGKGKHIRTLASELMLALEDVVPAEMGLEELDTVSKAKDAVVDATLSLYKLRQWGW